MINNKKVLKLNENEELYITNSQDISILKIKNINNTLKIEETKNNKLNENIEIKSFSLEDIKRFVLIEEYYQNIMCEEVDNDIKDSINKFLNYHYKIIYGKAFNNGNIDIIKNYFQSITYY